MIRRIEDLDEIAEPYLRALNCCFPGWGSERMFDWCFRRRAGGPAADLFVVEEDGRLIAGSATTYRRAWRSGRAGPEPIGCMTATWTIRAARGRGLFPRLIEESRHQARRRGCDLLIAFAGAGKASRPGLLAAGARAVEGAQLLSPMDGPLGAGGVEAASPSPEESMAVFSARTMDSGASRLVYEPEEWRGQMIDRPHPAESRRLRDGSVAVIDRSGGIDRVLDISTSNGGGFAAAVLEAAAISRADNRRLAAYSLDREVIAELTASGFVASRAWLYLMNTGDAEAERETWWFANGDRM